MNKSIYSLIYLIFIVNSAIAQKHSYFFGHRNFIGIGTSVPVSGMIKNSYSSIPINAKFSLEHILNSYLLGGVSLNLNNMRYIDKFNNDGKSHDYLIDYNGEPRKITDGYGEINLMHSGLFFNLKKYNKTISYVPIGRFYGLKLGLSSNFIEIKEGYEYKFTQYYGTLKKDYKGLNNEIFSFTKFHIGAEYGKTIRVVNDNCFLTVTASTLYSGNKKYSIDNTLIDRFKHIAEIRLKNQLFFSIDFTLSYGI